jgi:ADP-heptose:LPS heptosyltransferase
VLEHNPDLDQLITEKGFFATLAELRRGKFDTAVIFFVNFKVALLALLAGIPLRIGPASKLWSVFLNKRVTQRRSRIKKHEADYNLDLVGELGAAPAPRASRLVLTAEERTASAAILARLGLSGKDFIVALHPGSGGSALNWPKENYAALADMILKAYAVKILLTGSHAETPLLEEVASRMAGKPFVLREAATLRLFSGLISHCGLFVTNSTGPLHLAAALRVPTLSFFPPLNPCSPVRWGPYGGGPNKVLVPPGVGCARCEGENCPRYSCMAAITPAAAFAEAAGLLRSAPKAP